MRRARSHSSYSISRSSRSGLRGAGFGCRGEDALFAAAELAMGDQTFKEELGCGDNFGRASEALMPSGASFAMRP